MSIVLRFAAAVLAALLGAGFAFADPAGSRASVSSLLAIDLNRDSIIEGIVAKWRDSLRFAHGANAGEAESRLRDGLSRLRSDELLSASLAGSVEGLATAFAQAGQRTGRELARKAGTASLVYVPVTPCRILDTRYGAGIFGSPIAGGAAFQVSGYLSSFAAQGGSAGDCGLQRGTALVVVLTVVAPTADAFLSAGDSGNYSTLTSAAVVNFRAGVNIANTVIVPMSAFTTFYLALPAGVSAHVVADAVGYFVPPSPAGPANVLTVAKAGGDFTTIGAAITSIWNTVSLTNRFVVRVAPGTYDEVVTVPGYVTLEGSGVGRTTIRSSNVGGTVYIVGRDVELRDLDVVNEGAPGDAIGIHQNNLGADDSRLSRVAVYAYGSGGVTRAAEIVGSTSIADSRFVATGPAAPAAEALYLWGGGTFTIYNSTLEANGATDSRALVTASFASGTVFASTLTASGTLSAWAFENRTLNPAAPIRIVSSTLTAKDAAFAQGAGGEALDIADSIVRAHGPGGNVGVAMSGQSIRNTTIAALGGATNVALLQQQPGFVRVVNSLLDGTLQGSFIKCRGVYTAALDAVTCPF